MSEKKSKFEIAEGRGSVFFSPEFQKSPNGKDYPNINGSFKHNGCVYKLIGWIKPEEMGQQNPAENRICAISQSEPVELSNQGQFFISQIMPLAEVAKNRASEKPFPEIKIVIQLQSEPDVAYELPLWVQRKKDGSLAFEKDGKTLYGGKITVSKEYQIGNGNSSEYNQDTFNDGFSQVTSTGNTQKPQGGKQFVGEAVDINNEDDTPF